ncbi:31-O-demethyl-FK506 methyltransferase [Leishmania tarentolae]|uniref:31-O-demethyl-FK506 methyltransferase n=1 Tax=Leishmania tarentolae TaxID=5689 RepID=A0A640K839_LEITA|nr:31-O-demethyl-FK506 methyltransferase [Leishmania tarentolae]
MVLLLIAGCLGAYVALCIGAHRWLLHTGQLAKFSQPFTDASGCARSVEYKAVRGDWGAAMVAREIFQDRVYTRHGVHVPATGSPLVIDIGCNIGLFTMFVLGMNPQAIVVAAEPIPGLCALARENTAPYGRQVWVEQVGVSAASVAGAEFLVDPRVMAGSSMYEAEITRAWKAASPFTQLSVIARDNVISGNLPTQPTLLLCSLLEKPFLRWIAVVLLMPVLVLLTIFLLTSPSQRRRLRCECVPFAELLDRSTSRMTDVAMRRRVTDGPIALVKVDVEGSEWDVLQGIADSEWRRIERLVVEVHDIQDRVFRVERLLRGKGFQEVHVAQEEWASHKVLRIHSVFARRTEATE